MHKTLVQLCFFVLLLWWRFCQQTRESAKKRRIAKLDSKVDAYASLAAVLFETLYLSDQHVLCFYPDGSQPLSCHPEVYSLFITHFSN